MIKQNERITGQTGRHLRPPGFRQDVLPAKYLRPAAVHRRHSSDRRHLRLRADGALADGRHAEGERPVRREIRLESLLPGDTIVPSERGDRPATRARRHGARSGGYRASAAAEDRYCQGGVRPAGYQFAGRAVRRSVVHREAAAVRELRYGADDGEDCARSER